MENLENANASVTNVNNAKKEIAKKEKIAKVKKAKKESQLTKVNLSKFAEKFAKFGITEKSNESKQKSLLYFYPENFTSLQINGQIGKNYRSKLRTDLNKIMDRISIKQTIFEKNGSKDNTEVIAAVQEFNEFYKKNCRLNDFSISSLSHVKGEKREYFEECLNVIKMYNSKNSEKKSSKK